MRIANVLYKNELAGQLLQLDNGSFVFRYDLAWFNDIQKPSISLTLPKSKKEYKSDTLFPFFFNLLPEGANKYAICKIKQIDETDYFGILLHAAKFDTIGAVKIIKAEE